MSTVIEGLKYMASHEWAKVDGDTVTVGITDHAQAELGDVVYVELPEVGSEVSAKSTFGVVESVKAASDVYSPVSGEVVAVNEDLADSPGKVNEGAYTDGWMMKVKMTTRRSSTRSWTRRRTRRPATNNSTRDDRVSIRSTRPSPRAGDLPGTLS